MLAPRWAVDPLSGEGARRNGGRFNPKGTPALYMSFDLNTAVAEYQQDLRNRPGTFCVYRVTAGQIADLREPETRGALDISTAELACPWRRIVLIDGGEPPTWSLARRLIEAGAEGAIVPSTQFDGGANLVLWRWNDGAGCTVEAFDPEADLPLDQRSWSRQPR